MWHYQIWIHSPLTFVGVVHSNWPSGTMCHMHTPTLNKWHKKKKKSKNKKVTVHILTHGAMRGVWLTSSVDCMDNINHDIRERNVTTRSEIWTTNICSLGFQDIREWVILWGLILRSWGVLSWMIEIWMKKHLVSDNNCNTVNLYPAPHQKKNRNDKSFWV